MGTRRCVTGVPVREAVPLFAGRESRREHIVQIREMVFKVTGLKRKTELKKL